MTGTPPVHWRKSSYSAHEGGQCVEVARWQKSSYSDHHGGDCVEVGRWRKSSHSGHEGGECVEVAQLNPAIGVRDSKDPDGPKLVFSAAEWRTFTDHIKRTGSTPA